MVSMSRKYSYYISTIFTHNLVYNFLRVFLYLVNMLIPFFRSQTHLVSLAFEMNISAKSTPYSKLLQHVYQESRWVVSFAKKPWGMGKNIVTLSLYEKYTCLFISVKYFCVNFRNQYFKPVLYCTKLQTGQIILKTARS